MHIVYVTSELATETNPSGGLATFTANMARIFADKGHSVEILLVTTKPEIHTFNSNIRLHNLFIEKSDWDEYDFVAHLYYPDNEELATVNRREWIKVRKMELVRDKIAEINRIEKVDIVHLSNHGAFSMLFNNDIPYVVRISGFMNIYRNVARKIGASLEYKENPLEINDSMEARAIKKAQRVISPSVLLKNIAEENLGIVPEVLESPFLLSCDKWDESDYTAICKGKKYILFCGTMSYLKGINIIVQMIGDLLHRQKDYYFVLAGFDMELEDLSGRKALASQRVFEAAGEHSDRVIYLGRLNRERLYPFIKNAGVCLFPSRIENLSNACVEAMAMGKIVVATKGASYEQLIVHGENGFLCERDDVSSFLRTIEHVLSLDKENKKKLSDMAIKTVERLSPDNIYDKYLAYYQNVISEWNYF